MRLRRDGLVARELNGETVLLDLRSSSYLRSNALGTYVLTLLREDRTRGQLVESIVDRFDVPTARASSDLEAFLSSLRTAGLLDEAP